MQGFEIAVTLKGKTLNEVIEQAKALIEAGDEAAAGKTGKGKTGKRAAAVEEPDGDDEELLGAGEDEADDDLGSFDDADEETEDDPPPKKAKKFTDKDMNTAALLHAKANGGKAATLEILKKKFKVKSILELKPEQYAAAIKALKV